MFILEYFVLIIVCFEDKGKPQGHPCSSFLAIRVKVLEIEGSVQGPKIENTIGLYVENYCFIRTDQQCDSSLWIKTKLLSPSQKQKKGRLNFK